LKGTSKEILWTSFIRIWCYRSWRKRMRWLGCESWNTFKEGYKKSRAL